MKVRGLEQVIARNDLFAVARAIVGPTLFAPYARELGERFADLKAGALLETAAGSGIVTEVLVDNTNGRKH